MIQTTADFVKYFEGIRRRTMNYIRALPPDRLDWSPKAGEFTCGDILRHILVTEKMFVGVVLDGRWDYQGHQASKEQSLEEIIAQLEKSHAEAMAGLRQFPDLELKETRPSPHGQPIKAWRWMMAMAEHEIHHRSQLAVYLALLGAEPPQIFGLGVEDIIALTTG